MLFWVLMVGLADVLWQAQKRPSGDATSNAISYSDFLQQADKNNIASATFVLSQNTADVHGNLRDSAQEYRTTVPKESVSNLTDRLRKMSVNIGVSEGGNSSIKNTLVNIAPLIILVGFWIYMGVRRSRSRQAPPSDISNTPL
jgi:ATP-dependent Zn protease